MYQNKIFFELIDAINSQLSIFNNFLDAIHNTGSLEEDQNNFCFQRRQYQNIEFKIRKTEFHNNHQNISEWRGDAFCIWLRTNMT